MHDGFNMLFNITNEQLESKNNKHGITKTQHTLDGSGKQDCYPNSGSNSGSAMTCLVCTSILGSNPGFAFAPVAMPAERACTSRSEAVVYACPHPQDKL